MWGCEIDAAKFLPVRPQAHGITMGITSFLKSQKL